MTSTADTVLNPAAIAHPASMIGPPPVPLFWRGVAEDWGGSVADSTGMAGVGGGGSVVARDAGVFTAVVP